MNKKTLAAGLTLAVVLGLVLIGLAFAQLATPAPAYNGYGQGNGWLSGCQGAYDGPYYSGQQQSAQPPAIGTPQYPAQGFQFGFGRGCWGW